VIAVTPEQLNLLAREVIDLALSSATSIATAESLTGGLVSGALSSVPGASKVLLGGVVSYSDSLKTQWLGVSPQLISNQSAVDAEVAAQMAEGLRDRVAHLQGPIKIIALSTTGVAGPDPVGSNPVGTVFLGVAGVERVVVFAEKFEGDRESIRQQTVTRALEILREQLANS
jgi:nicotinamide-nucleotide amidase